MVEKQTRVGGLEVGVAALAYFVLQVVAGAAAFVSLGIDPSGSFSTAGTLGILAGTAAATLLTVVIAVAIRLRSLVAVGLSGAAARWVLVGAGAGLAAWAINRGVIVVYVWITGDSSNPQAFLTNVATGGNLAQFALLVALGGLLIPFGEELLFRRLLYGWLRRWGIILATAVSAVVFGLAHGLSVVLPAAIVLGILCALLYEYSGSIWPAAIAHATNNTLIFVLVRTLEPGTTPVG